VSLHLRRIRYLWTIDLEVLHHSSIMSGSEENNSQGYLFRSYSQ
jgi:hypothetical protein